MYLIALLAYLLTFVAPNLPDPLYAISGLNDNATLRYLCSTTVSVWRTTPGAWRAPSAQGEPLREEGLVALASLSAGEPLEQEAQVAVGFETTGLGCFDETVESGAGLCAVGMARKEPVLSVM